MAVCVPALAAEPWVRVRSQNFDVYTNAGEKSGREADRFFEQVRAFFLEQFGGFGRTYPPVRVVSFRSEKDYAPYRSGAFADAYYSGSEQQDYIVMQKFGSKDARAIALHEYTHLILRRAGLKLPVWLNEGLAEVYSTLRPAFGQVMLGEPIAGRLYSLRERWLALPELTGAGHNSIHYENKDKVAIFYAQSWLLTHMLYLSEQYSGRWPQFLNLTGSLKAEEAFLKVYGKTIGEIEKDLRTYSRSLDRFRVELFKTTFVNLEAEPAITALDGLEQAILLANVLDLAGRKEDAAAEFEKLGRENPKSVEAAAAHADFAVRQGAFDLARKLYARSVENGLRDTQVLMDYAELLMRSGAGDDVLAPVLFRTVDLDPGHRGAHYHLGFLEMRRRRYSDALTHFAQIGKVEPERAAAFLRAYAWAQAECGDRTKARATAELGRTFAKTPEEIRDFDRLLAYFRDERPREKPIIRAFEQPVESVDEPRVLTREARQDPPAPPPPRYDVVEGTVERLDCDGAQARLIVRSGNRLIGLTILKPNTVALKNSAFGTIDFTCGPQKARTKVLIEYEPAPDKRLDTLGDIRILEFR
jgi:tetratricopeptide (TPR) repeat protein